ncbi:MAG TPA: hypothetical protein GXX37_12820 [Clostridiaceae bacterium]|nr:hypothetical protein [Clostridiaceae bacterium]
MINNNFSIDSKQLKNDIIDAKPIRTSYINIFCPRCGRFKIRRHWVFRRRFLCEECGYKWKN